MRKKDSSRRMSLPSGKQRTLIERRQERDEGKTDFRGGNKL